MSQHTRVIGLDPAIKNYGYSVLEIREDQEAWRVNECGLISNPINTLSEDLVECLDAYEYEMTRLLRLYKPEVVVIERFQNRSRIGASQNEKVNIMIGLVAYVAKKMGCKLIAPTPSAWKNKVNAKQDLNDFYKVARSDLRRYCKEEDIGKKKKARALLKIPHTVDSTTMALFEGCRLTGIAPFKFINVSVGSKVVKGLIRSGGVR